MKKKSILQVIFLWGEVAASAGLLIFTIPVIVSDVINHPGVLVKSPTISILSLLAFLFLAAGVTGLRDRPTTKFMHLAGSLTTLIIALMMASLPASPCCTAKSGLLALGLSFYAVIVIYLFIFIFKPKAD